MLWQDTNFYVVTFGSALWEEGRRLPLRKTQSVTFITLMSLNRSLSRFPIEQAPHFLREFFLRESPRPPYGTFG